MFGGSTFAEATFAEGPSGPSGGGSLAGLRSMLALWVGGALAPVIVPPPLVGFPSVMAMWVGGARGPAEAGGDSPAWRRIAAQRVLSGKVEYDDDEEAITLLLLS